MMTSDAKFWDSIAEKYAAKPVENLSAFQRKKTITREHLQAGSTVLEIGCGTGTLALEMAPFAGHVHALDVSAEMLRIANQKRQAQGVTNVTFRQGTLDGPAPDRPEHFDIVWAYSILHLVPDRKHTLKTIFNLLKPGGSFISSNVCLRGAWVPYGIILTVLRWVGKAPAVSLYDREMICRELSEVGFVEVEERQVGAARMIAFIVAKKPV
jgi:arsenite methyltransferase